MYTSHIAINVHNTSGPHRSPGKKYMMKITFYYFFSDNTLSFIQIYTHILSVDFSFL